MGIDGFVKSVKWKFYHSNSYFYQLIKKLATFSIIIETSRHYFGCVWFPCVRILKKFTNNGWVYKLVPIDAIRMSHLTLQGARRLDRRALLAFHLILLRTSASWWWTPQFVLLFRWKLVICFSIVFPQVSHGDSKWWISIFHHFFCLNCQRQPINQVRKFVTSLL